MSGKNNPFGIKARLGEPGTEATTTEFLTRSQLAAFEAKGKTILSVAPIVSGKHEVTMVDTFADFESLDDAFLKYGEKFEKNKYFKPRLDRYKQHQSLELLVNDMTGADGLPPYATDPGYADKILSLAKSEKVMAALGDARQILLAEGKIQDGSASS